jgi:hypothetical protein
MASLSFAVLVAYGCTGSTQAGTAPPASFDPNSPTLVAVDIEFDKGELMVPAYRAFTLVFENRDENVPHNVSIYAGPSRQDRRYEGQVFNGPATRWYSAPALAPGTYFFACDIHPYMTGTVTAS